MDRSTNSIFGNLTSSYVWATLALILVIRLWPSLVTHIRICIALWNVPGPRAYPIVGNALMFNGGSEGYFQLLKECRDRYGPIFRLWIGPRAFVYLSGPDLMQAVLSSSVHIQKSFEYGMLEPLVGTGLLNSGGSKWHYRRKLLTSAFHSTLFENYVDSLCKNSDIFVSKLCSDSSADPAQWSDAIDVVRLSKLCALDAICETIMGVNINAQEGGSNKEYVASIDRISYILQQRFINPWLLSDFIFNKTPLGKEFDKHVKITQSFTNKVIKEREGEIRSQNEGNQSNQKVQSKRKSLLDLLLALSDNGSVISSEGVREEVDSFMYAGHDTTASGLSWTLYALGHRPELQEQILEEAKGILDEDHNGKITLGQINKMDVLDRVIKESMRIYSPVPYIARDLDSPLTVEGHTFPPGTGISLGIFMLHRDPRLYPEPNKFDPDRFLPSENLKRHPFAYIPFSAGPRNCIGQKLAILELKISVLKVLQSLEVKSLCEPQNLKLNGEIVLLSSDGVKLSFRQRREMK